MAEYYVFLNGVSDGPHSESKIQSMLHSKALSPDVLACRAGDADWAPLHTLLPKANSGHVPPALPSQTGNLSSPPLSDSQGQFMFNSTFIPGTQGLSAKEIVSLVARGGRFVTYAYAFSLVVITFRRSSPIQFLRPGEDGLSKAFGYSAISGLLGWWGFPWGPIYTIGTIGRNALGGVDVTEPVLAVLVGPQNADQIIRQRGPVPKGKTYLSLLWILMLPGLFFLLIFVSAARPLENPKPRLKTPKIHSSPANPAPQ